MVYKKVVTVVTVVTALEFPYIYILYYIK